MNKRDTPLNNVEYLISDVLFDHYIVIYRVRFLIQNEWQLR